MYGLATNFEFPATFARRNFSRISVFVNPTDGRAFVAINPYVGQSSEEHDGQHRDEEYRASYELLMTLLENQLVAFELAHVGLARAEKEIREVIELSRRGVEVEIYGKRVLIAFEQNGERLPKEQIVEQMKKLGLSPEEMDAVNKVYKEKFGESLLPGSYKAMHSVNQAKADPLRDDSIHTATRKPFDLGLN